MGRAEGGEWGMEWNESGQLSCMSVKRESSFGQSSSSLSAALRLLRPGTTTRVYVAVELHHFATFTSAGCDAGDTYIERAVRVLV